MKKAILTGVVFQLCILLYAQENTSNYGPASDSTVSNYDNQDVLGGPKTIGGQLQADNQKKESYFRVPIRVTKGWYGWKQKMAEDYGLQLGVNYTSLFLNSSEVFVEDVNETSASSGILDIQVGWNLVNRKKGKNKGTIFFKVNSRHSYDSDKTPPMFHGIFETGYLGLPGTGYNDYSIRMLELNWQQNLLDDKLTIVAGKVDPTNYFNFHGLIVPWTSFIGYGASVSGTINWPDMGFGAIAGYKISDNWYAMAGATDVRGDLYEDGEFLYFGENFFEGNFFKAIEVGWVPSMAERYFKKISLTYHHSNDYVAARGADIPVNQGFAFSASWFFNNKYAPYLRFAFSDGVGENTFYTNDIQIGNGILFRSHDLLGFAFGSAEVNDVDDRQHTLELYYRFQLTEHLAITPDAQLIINPALNPDADNIVYYGIRGRISF